MTVIDSLSNKIMDAEPPSPRLLHLLSRLADGMLDPVEAQELDAMLLADPEARAYYRCHAAVHVALGNAPEAGSKVVTMPATQRQRRWPAYAAAAALIIAAGTAWWSLRHDAPQTSQDSLAKNTNTSTKVLAVTYATDGLRWNLPQAATSGQRLGPGPVRVFDGEVSLSLSSGQLLHVKGPAEFELLGEGEVLLRSGPAALRTIDGRDPFIVHLPKGALVDMGSDFSVDVGSDGTAEVRVFENELVASTVGPTGDTLEELQLLPGKSTRINSGLSPGNRAAKDFLRLPPIPLTVPPGGEQAYAAAVLRSSPLSYWRFEQTNPEGKVPDETGRHPLQLMERARISGSEHQRYLVTNASDAAGFALPADGISDLDTARGITIEGLLFSSSESYGTALALELVDAPPPDKRWSRLRHAPQTFALERMGRKGEHIGHIHPDFSMRAMFRSPAGYEGGTNLYSRESHLLHRWLHAAVVHDGTSIRLYLDGELSASTPASLPFQNARLRPIIGRLQPHPQDELRQWIGGIDEVALYGRALSAEEVRAHAEALKP
jgi:hypothetical protein